MIIEKQKLQFYYTFIVRKPAFDKTNPFRCTSMKQYNLQGIIQIKSSQFENKKMTKQTHFI